MKEIFKNFNFDYSYNIKKNTIYNFNRVVYGFSNPYLIYENNNIQHIVTARVSSDKILVDKPYLHYVTPITWHVTLNSKEPFISTYPYSNVSLCENFLGDKIIPINILMKDSLVDTNKETQIELQVVGYPKNFSIKYKYEVERKPIFNKLEVGKYYVYDLNKLIPFYIVDLPDSFTKDITSSRNELKSSVVITAEVVDYREENEIHIVTIKTDFGDLPLIFSSDQIKNAPKEFFEDFKNYYVTSTITIFGSTILNNNPINKIELDEKLALKLLIDSIETGNFNKLVLGLSNKLTVTTDYQTARGLAKSAKLLTIIYDQYFSTYSNIKYVLLDNKKALEVDTDFGIVQCTVTMSNKENKIGRLDFSLMKKR